MPLQTGGPAPYAPPATVLELITAFRNRGIPTPFTKDVLSRAGVPNSLVPRTLQALRLLDLVTDAGEPTPAMEGLRRASTEEFPDRLGDVVRAAYGEMFQFLDPDTMTADNVLDQFRHYEPIGQIRRMTTLFMGLCEAAGIVEEGVTKMPPKAKKPKKSRSGPPKAKPKAKAGSENEERQEHGWGTALATGIPAPIAGLLTALPPESWTKAERDQFLATFTAVLDFTIKVIDKKERPQANPLEEVA